MQATICFVSNRYLILFYSVTELKGGEREIAFRCSSTFLLLF